MRCFNLLAAITALAISATAQVQAPTYHVGRTAAPEEIRDWDTAVGPEGKELPPGRGSAKEGAKIYAQRCARCHGPTGAEGPKLPGVAELWPYSSVNSRAVPPLRGGEGTLNTSHPLKTIGSFWPFATALWDYINRAMPPKEERSLSAGEVYALTAFLLYQNHIIKDSDVMDATSLPKVPMPNRNGFIPEHPEWKPPSGDRGNR
jgi:cytochrome c5